MRKSILELFLEDEIDFILENVIDKEELEKIKDKEHLKKFIKARLLVLLYSFTDEKIVDEFDEYKSRFEGVLYNEN